MSPKKSKKLIIITMIAILAIAIAFVIVQAIQNKGNITKLETIEESDAKYFILIKDNKYGVIDKEGQVVVAPEYEEIKIPNPTKDIFICLQEAKTGKSKAINSKNETLWQEYNSVEAIPIRAITSLVPYEKTILKYKQGNFYGIMDLEGKLITEAIYEEISTVDYKEGYLKVKKNGLYGVINIKGKEVLPIEYDNILSDGYYDEETKYSNAGFVLRTKTDEGYKFGYARTNGKVLLEPIYNEINRITEIENNKDLYLITALNGRYGLRKNNKTILENDYTEIAYDKINNILIVEKNNAYGAFDINGKNIIPIDYTSIAVAGEYLDATKDEQTVIFDNKGNNIESDFISMQKASEEYSIVIDKNNNYNIIDKNMNKLLTAKYTYIEYFKDDLFIVTNNSNAGLINANGKIVVPIEYSTLQKIEGTNCLQATLQTNNKVAIVNSEGKMQEGLEQATLTKEENYIRISSDTDIKYFTLDGNETTYKELEPQNEIYAIKQNGKWGFKDKNDNVIIECKYDFVTEQNGNVVGVKTNGKWGILDLKGNVIKNEEYELSWNNVSFLGEYYAINSNIGLKAYCGDLKN